MEDNGTNTIFIGKKGTMNYVLAVVTQFNQGSSSVVIKARGRTISKAVDVAEIVREKFLKDVDVKDIKISTEEVESDKPERKGETARVSAIEITLSR